MPIQRITPFLWFNGEAEDAANFYTAIFPNSAIGKVVRRPPGVPGPEGGAMLVDFKLDGQSFVALNGGPEFKFSEAISFVVNCDDQAEIDHYWSMLTDGGTAIQCGWLKDRFGISWQITPTVLGKLMGSGDPARSQRVMGALMQMTKLEIAKLQAAYDG